MFKLFSQVFSSLEGLSMKFNETFNEVLGTIALSYEKALAPHSSSLAWKILWTAEPGRLQSIGSLIVGHD